MAANLGESKPPLAKAIDEMESMRKELQQLRAEKMASELARKKAESERDEANTRNDALFQTIKTLDASIDQANKSLAEQGKSHSEEIAAVAAKIAVSSKELTQLLVENCSLKAQIKHSADRPCLSNLQPEAPSSPAVVKENLGNSTHTPAANKASFPSSASKDKHKTEAESQKSEIESECSANEPEAQSEHLFALFRELLEIPTSGANGLNKNSAETQTLNFDDNDSLFSESPDIQSKANSDQNAALDPNLLEKKLKELMSEKKALEAMRKKLDVLYEMLGCARVPETPQKEINEDFQRKIAAINAAVSSLLTNKKKYDPEIQTLKDELAKQASITETATNNLEAEKQKTKTTLEKQQKEFEKKIRTEIAKKDEELENLRENEENNKRKILEFHSQLEQRKAEVDKLNKRLSALTDANKINLELLKERSELQSKLKKTQDDNDKFKAATEDAKMDSDLYKQIVTQTKKEAAAEKLALEQALKELKLVQGSLEEIIQKAEAELKDRMNRIEAARADNRLLQERLTQLSQDNIKAAHEAAKRQDHLLDLLKAAKQGPNPPLLYAASMSFTGGGTFAPPVADPTSGSAATLKK